MASVLIPDVQSCNRASPYRPEGQIQTYVGLGLCDPALQNSAVGMVPVIYDSCIFQGTVAADDANIVFATAQQRNLFDTSDGATIDGGWYPKRLPETNTLRDGEMSRRGQQYIIFGFAFEAPDVFQQGGEDDDTATNPKLKSAWLAPAGDGPNYAAQSRQAVLENVAFEFSIVDTGSEQRGLPLSMYPQWGGVRGGTLTQNGGLSFIQYLANAVAVAVGTQTDGLESEMVLTSGQATEIESGSPATVAGTVYVWVRCAAFGIPCCMPLGALCGIVTADVGIATPPAGRQY